MSLSLAHCHSHLCWADVCNVRLLEQLGNRDLQHKAGDKTGTGFCFAAVLTLVAGTCLCGAAAAFQRTSARVMMHARNVSAVPVLVKPVYLSSFAYDLSLPCCHSRFDSPPFSRRRSIFDAVGGACPFAQSRPYHEEDCNACRARSGVMRQGEAPAPKGCPFMPRGFWGPTQHRQHLTLGLLSINSLNRIFTVSSDRYVTIVLYCYHYH